MSDNQDDEVSHDLSNEDNPDIKIVNGFQNSRFV